MACVAEVHAEMCNVIPNQDEDFGLAVAHVTGSIFVPREEGCLVCTPIGWTPTCCTPIGCTPIGCTPTFAVFPLGLVMKATLVYNLDFVALPLKN
jgi:hypothetical protein